MCVTGTAGARSIMNSWSSTYCMCRRSMYKYIDRAPISTTNVNGKVSTRDANDWRDHSTHSDYESMTSRILFSELFHTVQAYIVCNYYTYLHHLRIYFEHAHAVSCGLFLTYYIEGIVFPYNSMIRTYLFIMLTSTSSHIIVHFELHNYMETGCGVTCN